LRTSNNTRQTRHVFIESARCNVQKKSFRQLGDSNILKNSRVRNSN
jgi:hypothetical protein